MCTGAFWKIATGWLLVGCFLPHVAVANVIMVKSEKFANQPTHPTLAPPTAPQSSASAPGRPSTTQLSVLAPKPSAPAPPPEPKRSTQASKPSAPAPAIKPSALASKPPAPASKASAPSSKPPAPVSKLPAPSSSSTPKVPKRTCASERSCKLNATTEPICRYDEEQACIRKYPSKCHLDIASCKAGKVFSDASNDYCSLEPYLCEEGYEHWTIFFGHEKI